MSMEGWHIYIGVFYIINKITDNTRAVLLSGRGREGAGNRVSGGGGIKKAIIRRSRHYPR